MIHVDGNEVKCGNAAGNELIVEASKAVIAVFETLKIGLPKNITEHELMLYVLKEIGHNVAHYNAQVRGFSVHADGKDYASDTLDKYFGDLFGE